MAWVGWFFSARAGQANNTEAMHVLLDAGYVKKLAGSPCTFGAQHHTSVASTSHCDQVTSATPSLAWLSIDIMPRPSHFDSSVASMTWQCHRQLDSVAALRHYQHGSAAPSSGWLRASTHTSPTINPTRRITTDQTRGLQEYSSDRWPNSGTFLPTAPTSTRGEHVVTTMIWDTKPNQLSHFLSYILFWVNISIYF
jgi:hypothetical protein